MASITFEKNNDCGMILIFTLLLLTTISIIVLSGLQTSLLGTKMSTNFLERTLALQDADTNLHNKEQMLVQSMNPPADTTLVSTTTCGVSFYKILADGKYGNSKIKLQSTYAVIDPNNDCDPKPSIVTGRQSWRQREETAAD